MTQIIELYEFTWQNHTINYRSDKVNIDISIVASSLAQIYMYIKDKLPEYPYRDIFNIVLLTKHTREVTVENDSLFRISILTDNIVFYNEFKDYMPELQLKSGTKKMIYNELSDVIYNNMNGSKNLFEKIMYQDETFLISFKTEELKSENKFTHTIRIKYKNSEYMRKTITSEPYINDFNLFIISIFNELDEINLILKIMSKTYNDKNNILTEEKFKNWMVSLNEKYNK